MYRIEFGNSKGRPIFVQVDPWACLYKLESGDRIVFVVDASIGDASLSIDECDEDNRILTLDCEEFFIIIDGKQVHWEDYQSNIEE